MQKSIHKVQTILNFFVKHNHWFFLFLLEGISFMLIVRFNNYQNATFFTAANGVVGDMYGTLSEIHDYFGLRNANKVLLEHNTMLTSEVTGLRARIKELESRECLAANMPVTPDSSRFVFNTANIVNNSLNKINNYLVIDKGRSDGIESEMGVFDGNGVVGIVHSVSERYALIQPLLNSKSKVSCRVLGSGGFSSLQWDGGDTRYSYLVDLPRYTKFEKGDTVVTSGFSSIFPSGIPVGCINNVENSADGMFYRARVRLFVDFTTIETVFIVGNDGSKEQKELENSISEE